MILIRVKWRNLKCYVHFFKNALLVWDCVCILSHVCNPMDWSLPCFSVHGIYQARILERVATSYSRGSSWPRDRTCVSQFSYIGGWILYHCTTWEVAVTLRNSLDKSVSLYWYFYRQLTACWNKYHGFYSEKKMFSHPIFNMFRNIQKSDILLTYLISLTFKI